MNEELSRRISNFTPMEGDWLPLEMDFEAVFSDSDPERYYPAIFQLFERYPNEDGSGVFWSAVHGMESHGKYENLLLSSHRHLPSEMTRILLIRLKNSGTEKIGEERIEPLIET